MELFNLPRSTKVMKVIPKNYFDAYTSNKQKKLFTDLLSRITWQYKISSDTINLEAKAITEIQVFHVELKEKENIDQLLNIIDKAVPYHIIFIVDFLGSIYLSTSAKHPHPVSEDNAVIDWTFKTDWFQLQENQYKLNLTGSIEAVYQDFCQQLSNTGALKKRSLNDLVIFSKQKSDLEKEILELQKSIKSSQQFKQKVALNMTLKLKQEALKQLTSN